MVTCTIGPVKGKDYLSKKGYPCKADMGIDEVKTEVFYEHIIVVVLLSRLLFQVWDVIASSLSAPNLIWFTMPSCS